MASFTMPEPTGDEVRRGILYMIGSVFAFAAVNAMVKWQAATFPVPEIIFFRSVFALPPCFYLMATAGGWRAMHTRRLAEHCGRAAISFVGMLLIFTAYRMMPLADAVALSFSSPLFLTMLSIPLLGEQVGRHRWGAVIAGFVGVMLMVRPGSGMLQLGSLLVLANAAISASITIAIRRMTTTERSTTLVCYQVMITGVMGALLLPWGWVLPSGPEALLLAAMGLVSGTGQYWWTQACRFAPAAVAAPFSYMSMIWAMLFGYLVWGDVPTFLLLLGSAVVIASGLYIIYRETLRSAARPVAFAARSG